MTIVLVSYLKMSAELMDAPIEHIQSEEVVAQPTEEVIVKEQDQDQMIKISTMDKAKLYVMTHKPLVIGIAVAVVLIIVVIIIIIVTRKDKPSDSESDKAKAEAEKAKAEAEKAKAEADKAFWG